MSSWQFALQTTLTILAISLLNSYFGKTVPAELTENSGTIKPSKMVSILCVLVSGAMLTGGLLLIYSNGGIIIGLICGGMGAFGTIVMIPSISKFHNVSWDNEAIYGPSGKSFPVFPTKQIRIKWADIIKTDEAWSNYRFVENSEGEKIFWGYWYHGELKLRNEIQLRMKPKKPQTSP